MKVRIKNTELELIQGDITESETEAIVNAANSQLQLGGGVAGAIRKKGGPDIQKECDAHGPCPVGEAAVTTGGNLKANYVIHAVGPRWGEGDEEAKLRNATLHSLQRAEEKTLTSIAFPAISTGIFGFPTDRAAEIMLKAVRDHLNGSTGLKKVVFALFDRPTLQRFEKTLRSLEST
ncbi:MAG: O-acetyl-ADP-ribose deacetylase [Nitrospinaceae bacterium]|nr:macro domain-containing protein [Nitrospinaceae bacterium]NIR55285.1 macro domain-containing protein [Nitrospinaceae bacterium]NIS85724.1 macro domain-containing protein [Nitrospinaceae bacterium]NIT82574.1 macro domain-containing protein [Nitrospinaceae bacterium]NIU44779.1 macro domain-containing protein [Nitrospinaceae bacterium]